MGSTRTPDPAAERVGAVVGAAAQAGVMYWGATATDGALSVTLWVFAALATLGTLVRVAK